MSAETPDEQRAPPAPSEDSGNEHKAIVRLSSGEVLKGHIESGNGSDLQGFFSNLNLGPNAVIPIRLIGAHDLEKVEFQRIKSVFVVRSFRGDARRRDLHFYSNGPAVGSIWVEIQFEDKEVLEGLVQNSVEHLLAPGFLLWPSDPCSNNLLVYVNKASIARFRVLGVKGA